MLKELTYKKKNRFLLIGIIMAILLIYSLALKRTLNAYHAYVESKAQLDRSADAPALAAALEKELSRMEQKISLAKDTSRNQGLLELITDYCQNNQTVLREFPQTMSVRQGELNVETNRFVVQGNFASLLGLIYGLEQKHRMGKISSVKYQMKKDMRSKEMLLTATVFLQNIKNEKDAN